MEPYEPHLFAPISVLLDAVRVAFLPPPPLRMLAKVRYPRHRLRPLAVAHFAELVSLIRRWEGVSNGKWAKPVPRPANLP